MPTENAAAIAFYMGLLALLTGAIRLARSRLERKRRDPFALVLAGAGALGVIVSTFLYANGPHRLLPF